MRSILVRQRCSALIHYKSTTILTASYTLTDNKATKLRIIPRAASPLYTGRGELGERLARVFSIDPLTPPTRQRTFVIIGLGGTGKSEVCLKFAEEHDEYVISDILPTSC